MTTRFRISDVLTDNATRLRIERLLLVGWGAVNVPLGIWTGLGLALPSTLPSLQLDVSFVYENMLAAIYIPLGVCAVLAAFDPVRHKLLIIFIIASSFAHAAVMTYHALTTHLHLWPGLTWGSLVLFATGIAFLAFYPRGLQESMREK